MAKSSLLFLSTPLYLPPSPRLSASSPHWPAPSSSTHSPRRLRVLQPCDLRGHLIVWNEGLDVALVKVGCLGSSEAVETSRKSFEQTNQSFPVPDDDRTLVLGLGPMPNLYSAGSQSSSGKRVKLSATLFSQHCTTTDPGLVVGTSGGSSRNLQSTTVPGRKEHPHKRKNCIVFPLIDEGSTSTKRKSGDYELSPLFAPRSNHICIDGKSPEADVQEHIGTGYEADHDRSLDQHEVRLSPEPSETTGCSFVATSDTVDCTDNVGQKSHQRRLKKCRFNGCSKGGRGASGLCISHGGGHRCQKPGCNKGAESRTAYCKSHGGGKRCQELGCTKSAEGKTEFCIAHGGGHRCGVQECSKAARGRSGFCIKHGGGKRCMMEGCTRSAEGYPGVCIAHGGGRGVSTGLQQGSTGGTLFCKSHGGGKRCISEGCTKGEAAHYYAKGMAVGRGASSREPRHVLRVFMAEPASAWCMEEARGVWHQGAPSASWSHRLLCEAWRCGAANLMGAARRAGSTDFCKAPQWGKRCAWARL
ncbi:hypothetical protein ZWY2020_012262 [Hordeum vulgare]|nr:hypothetical protein ZWY2020_012262 [Hordeum vulgare]